MFMLLNDKAVVPNFSTFIDTGAIFAAVEGIKPVEESMKSMGACFDDSIVDPMKICEDVECRI